MASTCIYKEVHPPTGVTHAVSGYVTHTAEEETHPDLVICRGTELQVYGIRTTPVFKDGKGKKGKSSVRLEQVCRHSLYGVVESLAVLKGRSHGQRDAVLLTFRDAKVSVLEWCAAMWMLRVSSLHSLEGDPALKQGKEVFPMGPRVLTDPQGRFAAVLVFDNQLAVLPAMEADFFTRDVDQPPRDAQLPQAAASTQTTSPASTAATSTAGPQSTGRELAVVAAASTGPGAAGSAAEAAEALDYPAFGSAATLGNSYVLNLAHVGGMSGLAGSAGGLGGVGRTGSSLVARVGGAPGGAGRVGRSVAPVTPAHAGIQEVRDAVLLHGYLEPVLLVLHQPDPTWVGRYRERKDSCCVSAVSLSIRRKKQAVMWVGSGLPADALRLVAVPGRSAALLLTPVAILVVQQGSQYGVTVSSAALPGVPQPRLEFSMSEPPHVTAARGAAQFVRNIAPELVPSVYKGMPRVAGVEADLRGAAAVWLGSEHCLISCTSGLHLAVTLLSDGPLNKRIQVSPVSLSPVPPPCSCLVDLGGGLLFMGTLGGDSLLMQRADKAAEAPHAGGRIAKRARMAGAVKPDPDAVTDSDEGSAAGESEDGEGADGSGALSFRLCDSLVGLGPVRDMLHMDTATLNSSGEAQTFIRCSSNVIFAAVGGQRSSAVAMLRPGLVPELAAEVPLAGVTGVWAVHYRRDESVMPAPEAAGSGALLDPATLNQANTQGKNPFHAYLLLSRENNGNNRTMVLEAGEQLQEVSDRCPYVTDVPTLAAGNLFNLAAICQVVPQAIHVFDGQELLQELTVEELLLGHVPPGAPITIASAQIQDPYVLLLLSNGQAVLLEGDMWSLTLSMCSSAGQVLRPSHEPTDSIGDAACAPHLGPVTACCLYEDVTGWLDRLVNPHSNGSGGVELKSEADVGEGMDQGGGVTGIVGHQSTGAAAVGAQEAGGARGTPLQGADSAADTIAPSGAAEPQQPQQQQPQEQPRQLQQSGAAGVQEQREPSPDGSVGGAGVGQAADVEMAAAASAAGAGAGAGQVKGETGADAGKGESSDGAVSEREGTTAASPASGGLTTLTSILLEVSTGVRPLQGPVCAPAEGQVGASNPTEPIPALAPAIEETTGRSAGLQEPVPEPAQPVQDEPGSAHEAVSARELKGPPPVSAPMAIDEGAGTAGPPASQYLAVVRWDGRMDLYRLPEMDHVFCTAHVGGGAELLLQRAPAMAARKPCPAPTRVVEMRVESFKDVTPGGFPECERPMLLALTATGTLLVYQAFNRGPSVDQHQMHKQVPVKREEGLNVQDGKTDHVMGPCAQLGWRRVPVDWVGHQEPATAQRPQVTHRRLTRFDGVSYLLPDEKTGTLSYGPPQAGVFIAGARPLWLVAGRGGLVPHHMTVDGPVTAITPFHNVNCAHGFIMSCASGVLKVGHLPARERLDTPWATRKVKLPGGGVVQRLAHLRDWGLLAVAASRLPPAHGPAKRPRPPEEPGGDPHAVVAYAGAVALAEAGAEEVHEVRLLQLPGLVPAPGTAAIVTQAGDAITCLKAVTLKRPDADTPMSLLATGMANALGEDYPCLGRISLYGITKKVQRGATSWGSTHVASQTTVGPVTILHEFKGMLLAAVGKTVELYSLRPAPATGTTTAQREARDGAATELQYTLKKEARYESRVLITGLEVIKDFLLVADVMQGCAFLKYSESSRVIELLARDFDRQDLVSAGFLINTSKLLFAVPDAAGTLRQFEYVRSHPASWSGQRLVPGGALHMGHVVTRMAGFKMTTPDGANRHALLLSMQSGGWGCWAPLWDPAAATRLQELQRAMVHALPHPAGLNPRAFRRRHLRIPHALGGGEHWGPQQAPDRTALPLRAPPALHAATGSMILDGDLLWCYPQLTRALQTDLASRAGAVTPEQVLLDLTAWAVATTL